MRVLVTGSRDIKDHDAHWVEDFVWKNIRPFLLLHDKAGTSVTIVHGGCRTGADAIVQRMIAQMHDTGWPVDQEVHWAQWGKYNHSAGPIRNQKMVDKGADFLLAFPLKGAGNVGTKGCITMARKAGIEIRECEVTAG